MHGARDAVAHGVEHIEEHIHALERAVTENPGLAFDLAKTLIESICRTVLVERSIAYETAEDLPKLFRKVSTCLPFLPSTARDSAKVRKSLAQTLRGLNSAIQGVCELRNQCGFASHGAGERRPAMEAVQALLAAETADTIVGFIHRVHRQDLTPPPSPRARYEANTVFNDSVDEAHGTIEIYEAQFRPSKVLWELEPETYRVYLAEFDAEPNDADGGGTDTEVGEALQ